MGRPRIIAPSRVFPVVKAVGSASGLSSASASFSAAKRAVGQSLGVSTVNGTFRVNAEFVAGSFGVGSAAGVGFSTQPAQIVTHPSPVTVTAPNSATFTVTASGSPTLAYQWRKNGVNISGATTASYTLNPTTPGDTGSQFSCVVSNSFGSATSNSATLTVAGSNTPPQWSAFGPISFTVGAADVYALPVTDAEGNPITLTSVGTALPSGVTLDSVNRRLVWSGSGTAATTTSHQIRADDNQDVSLATLSLTTTTAGTNILPWTIGHAFKQGDVPSGSFISTDATSSQADVRNTWPDGSVKFAVISGRSSITANTPKAVVVKSTATPPSGSNVAEPATLDASVVFSGDVAGTYTLQSCIGVDRSTWILGSAGRVRQILGSVMSEFHYYRPTTDPHVVVWFYVRRYSSGETEVETVVENGWLNVANPAQKVYTVTVNIGGSTRYGPASLTHLHHTRWSRADWIGADPAVSIKHDVAYIKATKLVPNYVGGTPQESSFVEDATSNSAPFDQGSFPTAMGGAGWTPSIGVLPMWAARYYTNGDARAYQATVGHMRRYGRYGVHYRDESTGRPVVATTTTNIVSANSGISYIGNQTPSTPVPTGGTPPSWASSHHPMAGYDAYLLSGRWVAAEEMDFLAAMPQMSINDVDQFSSARRWGWCMRSIAASAALSPVSATRSASSASLALYCNYQYDYWVTGQPGNVMGAIELIANEQYTADGLYRDYAPWMVGYAVTSLAWASEIGVGLVGTDLTKLIVLRNHGHKLYIGLAGDETGYPYTQMSNAYSIPWGDGQTNDAPTTWYGFAQAYSNMVSRAQATAGATGALGQNFGAPDAAVSALGMVEYSELHGIACVAYAVDHGISGASASWSRISSAPNLVNNGQAFADRPLFAIRPRTA